MRDRFRREFSTVPALLVGLVLAAGCQSRGWEDPEQTFAAIVKAVQAKQGGMIYDLLDSARRAQVDAIIEAQMAHIDSLPQEERRAWSQLKGKSKREIYEKSMSSDPTVGKVFAAGARVVRVDTVICVTVEHGGQHDLLYLRPEGGVLRITNSPDVLVYGPRSTPSPRHRPSTDTSNHATR